MAGVNIIDDKRYHTLLAEGREADTVGVHKHTHRPGTTASRLGFRGRAISKKSRDELVEKLIEQCKESKLSDQGKVALFALLTSK